MLVLRYLAKEVFLTFVALVGILMSIIVTNQLAIYLNRASSGSVPGILILKLMWVELPSYMIILFPFGLHWIENISHFLTEVKLILKENGIFICNFPGSGTLNSLRKTLFLAEEYVNSVHFPHISPFIRFEDMTSLLQQAGFAENIIDSETIDLEYDSPISLMKDLKNFGESNIISNRTNYSITKSIYRSLENYSDNSFLDRVNLISLISSPTKNSIKLKTKYFSNNS